MPVFPSTEWLEAVARVAAEDPAYRKFGRVDVLAGLKVGDRAFRLTFDVFDVKDVKEVPESELSEVDFYLDMTPEQWRAMIESIRSEGHAGLEYTLNTLDLKLPDGLHHNAADDGYRADKFFRFNESLQRFFDLSAGVETTFA
jgi:hypothetical protein